jgi:anthranilate synthase component 1
MSLSKQEFDNYAAQGFNRIPLMREVLADLDTPLSIYLKLACGPYSYLFESVQGGEKWGRYSIIGLPARTLLRVSGNEVTVEKDGKVIQRETVTDPLETVRRFRAQYTVPEIHGLHRRTRRLLRLRNHPLRGTAPGPDGQARRHRRAGHPAHGFG